MYAAFPEYVLGDPFFSRSAAIERADHVMKDHGEPAAVVRCRHGYFYPGGQSPHPQDVYAVVAGASYWAMRQRLTAAPTEYGPDRLPIDARFIYPADDAARHPFWLRAQLEDEREHLIARLNEVERELKEVQSAHVDD